MEAPSPGCPGPRPRCHGYVSGVALPAMPAAMPAARPARPAGPAVGSGIWSGPVAARGGIGSWGSHQAPPSRWDSGRGCRGRKPVSAVMAMRCRRPCRPCRLCPARFGSARENQTSCKVCKSATRAAAPSRVEVSTPCPVLAWPAGLRLTFSSPSPAWCPRRASECSPAGMLEPNMTRLKGTHSSSLPPGNQSLVAESAA